MLRISTRAKRIVGASLCTLGVTLPACSEEGGAEPFVPSFGVDASTQTIADAQVDASYTFDGSFSSDDAGLVSDAALDASAGDAAVSDANTGDAAQVDAGPDGGASEDPLAKYGLKPLPISGDPIPLAGDAWTWIEFPNTKCRNGTPAGIGIRRNSKSEDLMIFLEGGGACFDDVTCAANPAAVGGMKNEPTAGILNKTDANNPLRDWNLVYIPYCTGDVHAGTKPDSRVSLLFPKEQFVGYLNMEKYLQRIVPTFPNPKRLLLTGISAGGFGASSTAVLVQRAYPNEKVMMIDDSGPPQTTEVVPPCLQKKMRELWGLDGSILKDCGTHCPKPDDYQYDMGVYLVNTFNDRPSGLISGIHDGVISGFFGAGNNGCKGIALVDTVPPATFEAGLLKFREAAKTQANFGTFYPNSTQHTWLTDIFAVKFTAAEVNGVKLTKWVADIVDGKGTSHVGP